MDPDRDTPDNGKPASAGLSDHALIEKYRQGDQQAASELYLRYAHRLRALARAQFSDQLARKIEPDDIVQSVFGSFFRGVNRALYDVPLGEELWRLLLVIALRKIRTQGTYHAAAKRELGRTVSLDDDSSLRAEDDQAARAFMQLVIDESLAQMSAQHKEMVQLRLEGYSVAEIAERTKRSKRTIERLLQQARTKLDKLLKDEPTS